MCLVLNLFLKVAIVEGDFPLLKVEEDAKKDVVLIFEMAKGNNYLQTTILCASTMDNLCQVLVVLPLFHILHNL